MDPTYYRAFNLFSKVSISSYVLGLVKDCKDSGEDSGEDSKKEITTIINPKGNEFRIEHFFHEMKEKEIEGI